MWRYYLIFLLAFVQYGNTLTHEYAYDDYAAIVNNEYTQKGFAAIPDVLTQKVYMPERDIYRPVPQLTFLTEIALFGNNPHVAHFTNVLLYALCCIALMLFINALFVSNNGLLAFYTTLLFLLLPVHSEVVSNIKSRDELLMLMLGLFSLYFFVRAVGQGRRTFFAAALGFFTLSFLSKENAITFLGIYPILIYYLYPNLRPKAKLFFKQHPLLCMAAVFIILFEAVFLLKLQLQQAALLNVALLSGYFLLYSAFKIGSKHFRILYFSVLFFAIALFSYLFYIHNNTTPPQVQPDFLGESGVNATKVRDVEPLNNILIGIKPLSQLLATMLLILGKYLQLLIIPIVLVYHYGYNQLPVTDFSDYRVWLSILVNIGLLLYGLWGLRRKSVVGFGILFYFITLSVYTHITMLMPETLQIGLGSNYILKMSFSLYNVLPDTLAERFLLLPSAGFCLVVVWAISKLTGYRLSKPENNDKHSYYAFLAIFTLLFLLYGAKTYNRNIVWKNNETLFTADIQNMPENAMAHVFYAGLFMQRLQTANSKQQAQEYAKRYLAAQQRAIEIYPKFLSARIDLGNAYLNFGQPDLALAIFNETLTLFPTEPAAVFALGNYYYTLENYEEALPLFEKAIALEKNYPEAYRFLAWCYVKTDAFEKAEKLLLEGAKLFPKKPHFYTLLSFFYLNRQQYKEAIETGEKALQIEPNDEQTINNLIKANEALGNTEQIEKLRKQLNKK